ncbi:MAG: flagellin [SAR324 cluster bacterium]|nr:flagellin [SAR324 cluster bacterium]
MRVNHNIPSLTALRHLGNTNMATRKNLERLSSGMKINSAADGPAQLMISEHMRAQISGIDQAIDNSETSISMIQTAEGAMQEVSNILINLRQLAIHAANEGANDEKMLQADQSEVDNLLTTLKRIADHTQFGAKQLLDGSNGVSGMTVGEGLRFVEASTETEASPESGYEVAITQVATRAKTTATVPIDVNNAKQGFSFTINEGGKVVSFVTDRKDVKEIVDKMINDFEKFPEIHDKETTDSAIRDVIARKFQKEVDTAGIDVDVYINEAGMLTIRARQFGSEPSFAVTSNVDGVLAPKANVGFQAERGRDISGTIGGETAIGQGQILTAAEGTTAQGLSVEFNKALGTKVVETIDENTGEVTGREVMLEDNETLVGAEIEGYVHVSQKSLAYHVGPNQEQNVKIDIGSVAPDRLAMNVKNDSGFTNLSHIDVTSAKGAVDSIGLIDEAVGEVAQMRGKLGAFQKNALESTLSYLRIAEENLTNAESVVRDTDMASEMSHFTKNQILLASGTAMAAQANQIPKSVLQLLAGVQG